GREPAERPDAPDSRMFTGPPARGPAPFRKKKNLFDHTHPGAASPPHTPPPTQSEQTRRRRAEDTRGGGGDPPGGAQTTRTTSTSTAAKERTAAQAASMSGASRTRWQNPAPTITPSA